MCCSLFEAPNSKGLESTSSSDSESSSRSESDSESTAEEPHQHPASNAVTAEVHFIRGIVGTVCCCSFLMFVSLNSQVVQEGIMLIGSWGTGSVPVSRTPALKVKAAHMPQRALNHRPLRAPSTVVWKRSSPARSLNLIFLLNRKSSLILLKNPRSTRKLIGTAINSKVAKHPPHPLLT